jgi:hypothetical protein
MARLVRVAYTHGNLTARGRFTRAYDELSQLRKQQLNEAPTADSINAGLRVATLSKKSRWIALEGTVDALDQLVIVERLAQETHRPGP